MLIGINFVLNRESFSQFLDEGLFITHGVVILTMLLSPPDDREIFVYLFHTGSLPPYTLETSYP